jgi:protoporphyrinogen oxidase
MTSTGAFDYCVVGAGPSGLTLAYKLLCAGKSVALVERDDRAGGLTKSHRHAGHLFDTGPKRFHTDDPAVSAFIHDVTGGRLAAISRSTEVLFDGRYLRWPLHSRDLLRLPAGMALRCARELFRHRAPRDPESFHDYIRVRYGDTIYRSFFEPYTRKFLRWEPEDIHADWATTGINRTVIDPRVSAETLGDLLRSLLLPQRVRTEFLYPREGGFGSFCDRLLELCAGREGFALELSDRLVSLEDTGREFLARTANGKPLRFEQLVWSGNLNDLAAVIRRPMPRMPYLNTVFYNVVCREEGVGRHRAQWIYVSRGDSLTSRITCMREFAPYTCPPGYYNFIAEVTDDPARPRFFPEPRSFVRQVLEELTGFGFIRHPRFCEEVLVNPVADTYPIYHRRYRRDFAAAAAAVARHSPRIHLLGRTGAFWYNNTDHSIRFALEMAEALIAGTTPQIPFRDFFAAGQAMDAAGRG